MARAFTTSTKAASSNTALLNGLSQASFGFWLNQSTIVANDAWCGLFGADFWWYMTSGNSSPFTSVAQVIFTVSGSSTTETFTGNGVMSTNTWQHVLAVFDGTQSGFSRFAIYVNGTLQSVSTFGSSPASTLPNFTSAKVTVNGGSLGTFGIAEICYWTAALNANEARNLGKGMLPRQVRPGKVVYYAPLWGLSGASEEPELSGNGNNLAFTVGSPAQTNHPPITTFTKKRVVYYTVALPNSRNANLFIWGNNNSTISSPLYLDAQPKINANIPLSVSNKAVSEGIPLDINSSVTQTKTVNLFEAQADAQDSIPLSIQSQYQSTAIPLFESGQPAVNNTINLMLANRVVPFSIPLFTQQQNSAANITLFMQATSKNRSNPLFLRSTYGSNSIPLAILNQFITNAFPLFTQNQTTTRNIPLYVQTSFKNNNIPLYLRVSVVPQTIPLYIANQFVASNTPLYLTQLGFIDTVPLFLRASYKEKNIPLKVWGHLPLSDSIPLHTIAIGVKNIGIPLKLVTLNPTPNADTLSLFTLASPAGVDALQDNFYLYLQANKGQSPTHSVRLFTVGPPYGTNSLSTPMFIGVDNYSGSITDGVPFFIHLDGLQDYIPLVMCGPVGTAGAIPTYTSVPLFLSKQRSGAMVPMVMRGPGIPTSSGVYLFTHCNLMHQDSIPLVFPNIQGVNHRVTPVYVNGF